MKVLFLGATGVVGRKVVPLLAGEFRLELAGLHADELDGMEVLGVDVQDFDATLALMQQVRPDVVVNCAIADYTAYRCPRTVEKDHDYHESTIDVNVRGAYHVYEAAFRANVPAVVFISSLTVMAGSPRLLEITGDEPPQPSNFYACTKLFGEQVGQVFSRTRGMQVTCLRLGQPFPLPKRPLAINLEDPQSRSMLVHFEDIAGAIAGALKNPLEFAAFNIVSDSDCRWCRDTSVTQIGYRPLHFFGEGGVHLRDGVPASLTEGCRELVGAAKR